MADPSPGGFAPDEPAPRKSAKSNPTGWRDDAATKGTSKTTLIVLTLFAIVGIGGAIAALLLQPDPPSDPLFVAVPLGEYDPPWSAPPSVYRDAALVTESFPLRGGRPTPEQTFTFQEKDKFNDLLASLKEGRGLFEGLAERPLVLFLAGLATVRDNTVYLVPARARYGDPSSWIPMSDILDTVAAAKAKKKFLILDLAYPVADPFGGTLRDDAAARLDELLASREKSALPFVVLTSTSPGELSLPMDPLRYSGFAFYLAEGLRGAADGYQGDGPNLADPDKTVTVGELVRFVKHRVERWARVAHDRPQTPKHYGLTRDTDFILSDAKGEPIADPAGPVTYSEALKAGWDDRAAARGRPYPAEYARLTDGLLRAEREWFGSGDADRTQRAWGLAQEAWNRKVRDSAGRDPVADVYANTLAAVAGHRLVVELQGKTALPPTYVPLREMMRDATIAAEAITETDPTRKLEKEAERAKAKERVKEKAKAWEEAVKDPETRTRMLWDVIAEAKTPSAEVAKMWQTEFASARVADRSGTSSEGVLLAALADVDLTYIVNKRVLPEYPHLGVAALVQAENAFSQLLAAGPNGFALVASRVQDASRLRASGQSDLFMGTREQCENAHLPLLEVAKKFSEARTDLLRWQEATLVVETATVTLIDALPGELIGPQLSFERWRLAAEKTAQLADVLSAARTSGQFRGEQVPPTLVAEVRRVEAEIRASFITPKDDTEPAAGLGGTRAKPSDLLPLQRLVAATLVSPARRKAVWDALQADAVKFHTSAREDDATDVANKTQARNVQPAKLGDRPTPDELVTRRGQASVSLLRVAGHPRAGQLAGLLEPLIRTANSVEAARTIGDELRTAWLKELPDTARAARVAPPGFAPYRTTTASEPPGLTAAKVDVAAYTTAARAALEADRPHRGTTTIGKTFYPIALRSVAAK